MGEVFARSADGSGPPILVARARSARIDQAQMWPDNMLMAVPIGGLEDYWPSSDGQRFIVLRRRGTPVTAKASVIVNWQALLNRPTTP
jgi:hypothetical protein